MVPNICSDPASSNIYPRWMFVWLHEYKCGPTELWNLMFLMSTCSIYLFFYLALQSRIRLFTASEVDCIFWAVIRCLSTTTCTASSWVAGKQTDKHNRILGFKSDNEAFTKWASLLTQLTCVWSTTIFHKVLHDQGQVSKVRPPHQFKHWRLSTTTNTCCY